MKGLLFTTAMMCFFYSFGQDTLVYRNGSKEAVKILKLERTYVDFYKWPLTGNDNVNSKSSEMIQSVIYQDGRVVNMVYYSDRELSKPREFMRSWVAVDIFDPFFKQITCSFQHSFRNGNVTLRVPVSTAYSAHGKILNQYPRQGYYSQNKLISSGLDIMFFFNPLEANGFLGGFSYEGGIFKYGHYIYYADNYGYYTQGNFEYINASFNGFYIRGGYFLNTMKHIALGIYTDVGTCTRFYISDNYNGSTYNYTKHKSFGFDMRVKVGIGYTF